jgi:hypothetical protein
MKFSLALILAAAMSAAAIPLPQSVPASPSQSLEQMLHGATQFSPNFLSGNFAGVATNLGEMVVGAATYPITFLSSLGGVAPKKVVQTEQGAAVVMTEPVPAAAVQ